MDSSSVNVVGRLARDPKFFGEDNKRRALFTVATSRKMGETKITTYADCIAWGFRADMLSTMSKGDLVVVVGVLDNEKEKETGYTKLRVLANDVIKGVTTKREDKADTSVPTGDTADLPF